MMMELGLILLSSAAVYGSYSFDLFVRSTSAHKMIEADKNVDA